MKKTFRILLVIFGLIVFCVIVFGATKSIYISSAQRNLKNGKYETAVKQYEILTLLEPKNNTYKADLADALLNLPFTYENQQKICDFLEKYEGERFAYSLEQKLKKFQSDLDLMIGSNYIEKAPLNNQIVRWEDDAFPLKVSILGGDEIYKKAVKEAFDYWTKTTKNFFSFAYTDNPNEADVKVSIVGQAATNCQDEGCYYVAALTEPEIKHDILQYTDMKLYTQDPYGRTVSPEQLQKVTMHEIGHVLGIMGHSENPEDIMYASEQHNKQDYFSRYRTALSHNDINTLNYLYMIVPHVSNLPKEKLNKINKIHPNVVLGTSAQIKQKDIQDALNYIHKAPNLAIGYFNLGNAYVQSELYTKALNAYRQAFDLSVDKEEKYNIVYNMATTCIRMKDSKKALEYAEYAQKINPTDEIRQLIHDIKYPMALSEPGY